MGRGIELFLIVLVGVLLFGAKRLPGAARSLGESIHVFKKAVRDDDPAAPPPGQIRNIPGRAEPDPDQGRHPGA